MELTIDQLAALGGTTTRSIRSFQTMGLLDHPELRGRTGLYSALHLDRLRSILRLQDEGFTLQSLQVLLAAHARGDSLGAVLGLESSGPADVAELYGFAELQGTGAGPRGTHRRGRRLLSVVPSTLWDQTAAS
ncbi:MAG TPA: MerR family transcriptional regulator [Acidimicrobiales bacterium]|nr:MerR family transcriptional regulator [Acidimicrobiales bacterium]